MLFDYCCSKYSNHIALEQYSDTGEKISLTYQQLYMIITYLENQLHLPKENLIAIYVQNPYLSTLCIYLCLKLELPFYIINFKQPKQVITKNIKKLNIKTILSDTDLHFVNISVKKIPNINLLQNTNHALHTTLFSSNKKIIHGDKFISYIETSGSSAQPKIMAFTYKNIIYSAIGTNYFLKLNSNSTWILQLPLYHVAGLLIIFRCLLKGMKIIFPMYSKKNSYSIFKVLNKQNNLSERYVTSMVPTQLISCLPHHLEFLKKMYAILLGGSSTPVWIQEEVIQHKLPVFYSYGMTETTSNITLGKALPNKHSGYVGKILPSRKIKINNLQEIFIQGNIIAQEWKNNQLCSTRNKNNWFKTSDLGFLNQNKELILLGRKDSVFISGGENINPHEIEEILYKNLHCLYCFIIPWPDKKYIYRPIALIYNKSFSLSFVEDVHKIIPILKKKLPKYKLPYYYLQIPLSWIKIDLKNVFKIQKTKIITPDIINKLKLILS